MVLVRSLLMFAAISGIAYADETGSDPEPKIVYKEKTEIDFEAIDVEGQLVKPQGSLLLERRGAVFNPLIKLRKDFDQEMDLSVNEIK